MKQNKWLSETRHIMKLKTFRKGGVHPLEHKLSAEVPIEVLPLPGIVTIPLSQVLGAAAVPVIEKGDKVLVGQLIARGEAFISANVHSSVSGTVNKITEVTDSSGYERLSVVIDVEGDEWLSSIDRSKEVKREISLTKDEIIKRIQDSGIVGMGGANFPSHVKLLVPAGKRVEVLLINGVECEPYLTADHRVMLERSEELMVGISILMKALDVKRAIIGVENNKAEAIAQLQKLSASFDGIEVCGLKVKYPQGGEKQLIKAITGREVPSGKLPVDVGAVVHNVGTALAVYEAVQKNKPLFERVVTVTGKEVKKPSNFLARIGVPVSMLIEHAGGLPDNSGKVISGGPMMGKALSSLEVPVVKGMSGVVVMSEKDSIRIPEVNCIRCGRCITVCPMGLPAYLLASAVETENLELAEHSRVMDCIECGSCHYTCPSGRPLLDQIRVGKSKIGQIIRSRKNN